MYLINIQIHKLGIRSIIDLYFTINVYFCKQIYFNLEQVIQSNIILT
jgi:hypothetical protein